MEISIDRDTCIGSGMCMSAAPEVFDLDYESKAYVLPGAPEDPDAVQEAIDLCPVEALRMSTNGS